MSTTIAREKERTSVDIRSSLVSEAHWHSYRGGPGPLHRQNTRFPLQLFDTCAGDNVRKHRDFPCDARHVLLAWRGSHLESGFSELGAHVRPPQNAERDLLEAS